MDADVISVSQNQETDSPIFALEPWFADTGKWPAPSILARSGVQAFLVGGRLDILLLTVNQEEFKAAIQRFCILSGSGILKANVGQLTVYFGRVGQGDNLSFGIVNQAEMGPFPQFNVVTEAIEKLKPRAIVSVGVGWGNKGNDESTAAEGDVMVSQYLAEFTNNTKIYPDNVYHSRSEMPPAGKLVFARFQDLSQPGQWVFTRPDGSACQVLIGKFATGGLLLNNATTVKHLTESPDFRDAIGGDMEAWGLYQATGVAANKMQVAFQWIVVKGICDWGFGKSSAFQPLAAAAAADLVHAVFSAPNALPALQAPKDVQVARKVDVLLGRKTEVDEITKSLEVHRFAAIWGGAGEGKSSIAMEAAMNLWEKGRYLGGVFQVDLTGIAKGNCLEDIASLIMAKLGNQGAWADLLKHLNMGSDKWVLLIFDNSEELQQRDEQGFYNALKSLHTIPCVSLLVTSRQSVITNIKGEVKELHSLDVQPAIMLLKGIFDDAGAWKPGQAEQLASEICKGNAFALEIIAGFLKAKRCTIEEVILQGFQVLERSKYLKPILPVAALVGSYIQSCLDEELPLLAQLLVFPGSFNDEGAQFVLQGKRLYLEDLHVVSILQKYHLKSGGSRYTMHLLVRESLKLYKTVLPEERFVEWMLTHVGKRLVELDPRNCEKFGGLVEALEILSVEMNNIQHLRTSINAHPDFVGYLWQLASALDALGFVQEATNMWKAVLDVELRVLGPEHPDTLASMNNEAISLESLGQFIRAEAKKREVLKVQTRIFGEMNPNTLISMSNLATSLNSLGRYAEAEALGRQVLRLRNRVLGPAHRDTLTSMNNLANTLDSLGQPRKAEAIGRKVLGIRTRVLGPKHPSTLTSMSNLAISLDSLGRFVEAEEMGRKAVEFRKSVLGPEHPRRLGSLVNQAVYLHSLGRCTEAEEKGREVMLIQERVLGPDHPDKFSSKNNLANFLACLGRLSEAVVLGREAVDFGKRVLGQEHPRTLKSISNLEIFFTVQGLIEEGQVLTSGAPGEDPGSRVGTLLAGLKYDKL